MPFWDVDSGEPKEPCIRWGAQIPMARGTNLDKQLTEIYHEIAFMKHIGHLWKMCTSMKINGRYLSVIYKGTALGYVAAHYG